MQFSVKNDKGNMRNKRSLLTVISSLGLTFCNGLLGIIVTRIILVQFGSDFNGLNSTANQIVNMMLILEGGFTLASNVALFAPLGTGDLITVNGILTSTKNKFRKIGAIFFAVGLLISVLYAAVVNSDLGKELIFTIILMALIPQAVNLFFTCTYRVLLQAEQREYIINFFTLITVSMGHIINILTIPIFKQMWLIRFFTMLFSVINCALIILYVKKKYQWMDLHAERRDDLIVGTRDVLVQKITGVIYNSAPIVFLSISPIGGTKLASVYAVYNSVFAIIKSILHGIIDAPKQGIGQLVKEADKDRLWNVFEQYEYVAIYTIFCFMTTSFVMIIPFVTLYTASVNDVNYTDFGIALAMILISIVELFHIPSGQLINMSGRFDIAKKIQLWATVLIIISMTVLGYLFGVYGFLTAVLATAVLLAVLEMGYVHVNIFDNKLLGLAKITIPLLICGIAICLIESKIGVKVTGYVSFFIYALVIFVINCLIGAFIGLIFNRRTFLGLFSRIKSVIGGR